MRSNIDSRQLLYFVTVADALHFARAADRLGVAQSAVSVAIQGLERAVGTPLLSRNKRQPISLTDAGRLFHAEAVAALRHMERAEQVGKLAARGVAGIVRLGYVASGVTTGLLSRMLTAYRQSHENVRMDVVAMETPKQLEAIGEGEIDVGIVRPRARYPDGVNATVIHSEPVLVAMADSNRLAAAKVLACADLRSEVFVSPQFNEKEGFAEILEDLGKTGGFVASAEYKVFDFISAVSLAAAGYGVAVVPESIRNFSLPGIVYKPVSDFRSAVSLAVAYRERNQSPAVRDFLESALACRDIRSP